MSYSHIRYIAYHLPTVGYGTNGLIDYSQPAGLLLDYTNRKLFFPITRI